MRILAQDDRALKTGMIYLHESVLTVLLLVDTHEFGEKRTVGIRIPTTIAARRLHLHTCHREATGYHCGDIILHVFARTAGEEFDDCLASLDVDDGEVAGCLNNVGISRDHAYHTVVNGIDGIHQIVLNLNRHLCLWTFHILCKELNTILYTLVFVDECVAPFIHHILQCLYILRGQCEHHLSVAGDGIAHIAAVPCGESGFTFGYCLAHETHHKFVGISASSINLQS